MLLNHAFLESHFAAPHQSVSITDGLQDMPFCFSPAGHLIHCHTPSSTMSPHGTPSAAASTNVLQKQETTYNSLNYHPETLILSGISTIVIIIVILLCWCGAKRMCKMARQSPQAQLASHVFHQQEHLYAQPNGGVPRVPQRNV